MYILYAAGEKMGWLKQLQSDLINAGVDAVLDRGSKEDKLRETPEELDNCDVVLLVCTPSLQDQAMQGKPGALAPEDLADMRPRVFHRLEVNYVQSELWTAARRVAAGKAKAILLIKEGDVLTSVPGNFFPLENHRARDMTMTGTEYFEEMVRLETTVRPDSPTSSMSSSGRGGGAGGKKKKKKNKGGDDDDDDNEGEDGDGDGNDGNDDDNEGNDDGDDKNNGDGDADGEASDKKSKEKARKKAKDTRATTTTNNKNSNKNQTVGLIPTLYGLPFRKREELLSTYRAMLQTFLDPASDTLQPALTRLRDMAVKFAADVGLDRISMLENQAVQRGDKGTKRSKLHDEVEKFVSVDQHDQTVCLLLGDRRTGKSTFIALLQQQLWDQYVPFDPNAMIPVRIDLRTYTAEMAKSAVMDTLFRSVTAQGQRELKTSQLRFLFIFDGYDEMKGGGGQVNLWDANRLGDWAAGSKAIFCARPDALPVYDYQKLFYPTKPEPQPDRLLELRISPLVSGVAVTLHGSALKT